MPRNQPPKVQQIHAAAIFLVALEPNYRWQGAFTVLLITFPLLSGIIGSRKLSRNRALLIYSIEILAIAGIWYAIFDYTADWDKRLSGYYVLTIGYLIFLLSTVKLLRENFRPNERKGT